MQIYDKSGSLSWPTRMAIYALSLGAAVFVIYFFGNEIVGFFEGIKYKGPNFSIAILAAVFGLILGFGRFIIKTSDTKKQFKDTFNQNDEQQFSRAVHLFSGRDDGFAKSVGLRLLIGIRNNPHTSEVRKSEIDNVTSSGFRIARATLQNANLMGAELHRADMQGADMHGAILMEAKLQGANLQEANLHGAILMGAKLQGANLQGADLQMADLQMADLNWTILQKAILEKARLLEARLQGARMQEAKLQEADLHGADMHGANLLKAILLGAKLKGAKLQEANLQEADLQGADLQGAKLQRATYNAETKFPDSFDPQARGMRRV